MAEGAPALHILTFRHVLNHVHTDWQPRLIHSKFTEKVWHLFYSCYWVTPGGNDKICAHSDLTADGGWTEIITHLCRLFMITNMFILIRKITNKKIQLQYRHTCFCIWVKVPSRSQSPRLLRRILVSYPFPWQTNLLIKEKQNQWGQVKSHLCPINRLKRYWFLKLNVHFRWSGCSQNFKISLKQ